ncbi:MAG: J domain-containing protein [Minwuiales bacterium]|nr:J domain-containing protein [Minwuiales bacterium]
MVARHDPYEVLGLSPNATADEVKAAYRRLAKKYHPDLNPGDALADQRFHDVRAAFDSLRPNKRLVPAEEGGVVDGGGFSVSLDPEEPVEDYAARAARRDLRRPKRRMPLIRDELILGAAVVIGTLLWIIYYLWNNTKTNWF